MMDRTFEHIRDLESFIRYTYTGEISITENNALNLMETANYLREDGIKAACISFLDIHLKVEKAYRAYKFADAIGCISLKIVAKELIRQNFDNCSETTDYLNFSYEDLIDILSDGRLQPVKQQQTFFKVIIKGIIYNINTRKTHINDLLSSIDLPTLIADFLIDFFHKIIDSNDDHSIIKDVILRYHTSKIEQEKSEKTLLVVGFSDLISTELEFQYYSFIKNSNCSVNLMIMFRKVDITSQTSTIGDNDGMLNGSSTVLYDKVYYTSRNQDKWNLKVFDAATREINEIKSLNPFDSNLEQPAICACSKFLYLSGVNDCTDNNVKNQVLKYDPLTDYFENLLTPMGMRYDFAQAIYHQGFLYYLGGFDNSDFGLSSSKKWTTVKPMHTPRKFFQLAILNEKLCVVGGKIDQNSVKSVEVYDPVQDSWQSLADVNYDHTFVLISHQRTLLSVGRNTNLYSNISVEVYHPSKDQWQIDYEMSAGFVVEYPIVGGLLISSDCIFENN